MRSNLDGTWLDPDGRPQTSLVRAAPVPPPAPAAGRRRGIGGRLVRAVARSHYTTLVSYPVGGFAAMSWWSIAPWRWWMVMALSCGAAFVMQLSMLVLVFLDFPDPVRRRAMFAQLSVELLVCVEVVLLVALLINWRQPGSPGALFVAGLFVALTVALLQNLRALRALRSQRRGFPVVT